MENFTFYSPTYFVFGKDGEDQAGTILTIAAAGSEGSPLISRFEGVSIQEGQIT